MVDRVLRFRILTPSRQFSLVEQRAGPPFPLLLLPLRQPRCAANPDKVCYVYQDCKKLLGRHGRHPARHVDCIDRYRDEAPGAPGAGRLPNLPMFADGGATGDFSVPAGDEEPEIEPDFVPEPDEAVEDGPRTMGPRPHPPRTMRRVVVLPYAAALTDKLFVINKSLLPQLSVIQCQDLLQIAI